MTRTIRWGWVEHGRDNLVKYTYPTPTGERLPCEGGLPELLAFVDGDGRRIRGGEKHGRGLIVAHLKSAPHPDRPEDFKGEETWRKGVLATGADMLAFDLDEATCGYDDVTRAVDPWAHVRWSTYKSGVEGAGHRERVLIPTAQVIPPDGYENAWMWLAAWLSASGVDGVDLGTHDIVRISYCPDGVHQEAAGDPWCFAVDDRPWLDLDELPGGVTLDEAAEVIAALRETVERGEGEREREAVLRELCRVVSGEVSPDDVFEARDRLREQKIVSLEKARARAKRRPRADDDECPARVSALRAAATILDTLPREVAAAPKGARFNTMRRAAFTLGGWSAARYQDVHGAWHDLGAFSREDAASALYAAARLCYGREYDAQYVTNCIETSLTDGAAAGKAKRVEYDAQYVAGARSAAGGGGARRTRSVTRTLAQTQTAPAGDDPPPFEADEVGEVVADQEDDEHAGWEAKLKRGKGKKKGARGPVLKLQRNMATLLRHHPDWRGVISFNAFTNEVVMAKPAPWVVREPARYPFEPGQNWTDQDDVRVCYWFGEHFGWEPGDKTVCKIVEERARGRLSHPVREYLEGCTWDGVERLEHWLQDCLGVEDNAFARLVGKWWLISAVARVMQPGCQADHVLIIEGEQGIGKSSALRALVPDEEWFFDSDLPIGHKDAYSAINGCWIVEMAELTAVSKKASDDIKHYLTGRKDKYRPSYGRKEITAWRQCVFAGTINPNGMGYLRDETGGRRFWPVVAREVNLEGLLETRDLLWAEALARYRRGERYHPETDEEIALCKAAQIERYQNDAWEDVLAAHLTKLRQKDGMQAFVTMAQLLGDALGVEPARQKRQDQTRVGKALKVLGGWRVTKRTINGARVRGYTPDPTYEPPVDEEGVFDDPFN